MSWRERGKAMAPAVLAACSIGAAIPAAARSVTSRSKRSSCSSVNAMSSCLLAVRHGQVRPDPLELQPRLGQHGGRDVAEVVGCGADPMHAGVDLHVDGDR